jgi:ribosome biogenesis GTPase
LHQLLSMGFGPHFLSQLDLSELDGLTVGRVTFEAHGHLRLLTPHGERAALIDGPLRDRYDRIVVGDWVVYRDGDPAIATRRLERTNALRRRDPGGGVQVVAANLDVAWICIPATGDPNVRRLERWQALAADAGVRPIAVVTKSDAADPIEAAKAIEAHGVEAIAVSAIQGTGIEALLATLAPGATAALLGLSGVGKSTLVNRLLGGDVMETGAIRESDGRGRHTTTARHLFRLPNGGWLVDNPGVRAVGLVGEAGLEAAFPEIDALRDQCRFRDCSHDTEPGCAILGAIDAGELDPERFAAWRKLQKELAFEARRDDPVAQRAERDRWKKIHMAHRQRDKLRGR